MGHLLLSHAQGYPLTQWGSKPVMAKVGGVLVAKLVDANIYAGEEARSLLRY